MFSGIEEQFHFYGRNRSLTTIRGASYKLGGTELSVYVRPFLRYLQSPRIDFSRWDIVIRCGCPRIAARRERRLMNSTLWKASLLMAAVLWLRSDAWAQASYDLRSPDNSIEVRI